MSTENEDIFGLWKESMAAIRRLVGQAAKLTTHIEVTVSPDGVSVQPEAASVYARGTVQWNVTAQDGPPPFRLTIYFADGSPFRWSNKSVDLRSQRQFDKGVSISGSLAGPGNYKYGVRAETLKGSELIEDDDPYLYVLSQ